MPDEPEVKTMSLDKLFFDPRLQMRAAPDPDTVAKYRHLLDKLDPIKAVLDPDGVYWVWDGHQTGEAAKLEGRSMFRVEVREGSFDDALALAAGANADHPRGRTRADVEKAVAALLAHPRYGAESTASLCRRVNAHHSLVSPFRQAWEERQRKEAAAAAKEHPPGEANGQARAPRATPKESPKRVGADGKAYPATAKRKKAGRVKFDAKRVLAPLGKLRRAVDELYRAYGRANARGFIDADPAHRGMCDALKRFEDGFRERHKQLAKEPLPEA